MSGMDDLVTWLRAQLAARERELDEDEQVALTAAEWSQSTEWFSGAEGSVFGVDEASELHVRGAVLSLDDIGAHIARWDPKRVLREVETGRAEVDAKRQRIEHYLKIREYADPTKRPAMEYILAEGAVGRSLKFDALPYAERDGFREEWRP